ncbi:uncharacterized protein LOC133890181 [Phragmites australis]|uniref:uncharacterized protein LOC133890181 n=1 Tax=Phragmites australis TaxID=29695 RepID=UPI002D7711DE|nr:uncharacterized protein LOC133890181 [Phragmites australis]
MASPRRPRPAAADWSSMHVDLVECIAERVLAGDLIDYVRLRAACSHWRSCTVDPRGRGVADPRFHPRLWMMLPEGHGLHPGHAKLCGHVRFFNRYTGALVSVHLPLFVDHAVLDSTDGLVLLQRDVDTTVHLLNPFTGDICELPPLKSVYPQLNLNLLPYFRRVSAAVSVAPATGTITVLLALEYLDGFAHASTGDRGWTLTRCSANSLSMSRTLPFHGSLYMVQFVSSEEPSILRLDPPLLEEDGSSSPSLPPPQTIAKLPANLMIQPRLVECDSEILVVGNTDISCSHLVVIRLADLLQGRPAAPLTSIGDHCLIFGMRSLAVSSKGLPSISRNSIIICDIEKDRVLQYNLGDGTLLPACDGDTVRSPPPCPHSMVNHLITCCYRHYWNKGLIYCSSTRPWWTTKEKWRRGS